MAARHVICDYNKIVFMQHSVSICISSCFPFARIHPMAREKRKHADGTGNTSRRRQRTSPNYICSRVDRKTPTQLPSSIWYDHQKYRDEDTARQKKYQQTVQSGNAVQQASSEVHPKTPAGEGVARARQNSWSTCFRCKLCRRTSMFPLLSANRDQYVYYVSWLSYGVMTESAIPLLQVRLPWTNMGNTR